MNNKLKVQIIVVLTLMLTAYTIYVFTVPSSNINVESDDTTSIVVERLDSHSAIVNYSDANTSDYLYVEVEYPDADYTTEEHLNLLIVEAIDKLNRTYQGE